MIGSRIESRRVLPWGSLLLLTAGFCMFIGGIANGEASLAISSALPFSIGLSVLFLGHEKKLVAEFAAESIEIENPPTSIPYAGLKSVRAGGIPHEPSSFRKARSPILVEHDNGVLQIPPRLNVPSHEVYRFLAEQVPTCGNRAVNSTLAEYLERQESYYGPEQIWTYNASVRKPPKGRFRAFRGFCYGLILAGLVWMFLGFAVGIDPKTGWGGVGILCSSVGVALFLITLVDRELNNGAIRNWRKSSIVITPQGMAMVQGDLQGEVRWPELLDIRFRPKPRIISFQYSHGLIGILLKLRGADILIADIYDRPLYVIHERILAASGRSCPEEIDL
jgi:hypothetical protein